MNFKNYLIPLSILLGMSGCTNDSTSDLTDNTPILGDVTYVQNVKSIIDNNCISCHAATPVNGAPMPLVTYENVKDAVLNRPLLDRISRQNGQEGLMPNGGPRMPQNNIDVINQWVTDGLLEQ